jgi:cardiolipin synthase
VVFDDIGCMQTLPGNYAKQLSKFNIKATPFSRLKGQADNEFNNRSHRKIMVIDGLIGYTGGINIADEYINKTQRFGHWKDVGIRLEGKAVYELTKLFLIDYGVNVKKLPDNQLDSVLFPPLNLTEKGYIIPFGDGPAPIYQRRVAKSLIVDMLSNAKNYAYIMTPYLIIDNDTCLALENAALKGVDVKIIVPHIPDKKIVFEMTKTFYERLMKAGVKIYEYEKGFVHAKCYLVDDKIAMVGTINMDYRSLVHHFENGVWLYDTACISDIKKDMLDTLSKSIYIKPESIKTNPIQRFIRAIVRIFAPLL